MPNMQGNPKIPNIFKNGMTVVFALQLQGAEAHQDWGDGWSI